ncbi:hypothetical protein BFW38_16985 [Terasakiispira papahanaumokuakeensis]|uniref:DUF2750 domain-containing protein n=1 Tax=Terasakiispira papahanaumokuakeensis TaxID=197479 RepID=A0A1E2VDC1_9GAMM|nr:DUF2750 domain-containing protein [Terasakiispira papahanaumokuakeensis]ODC04977.1 hypothetical protein BFW38_16985 [Terasakiispira papahanaumokuakeensis]
MPSKEYEALKRKEIKDRYVYTVKKIADNESAWGLYNDGWVLTGNSQSEFFPIWPTKESAEVCAKDEWKDAQVKEIGIDYLIDELLLMLKEDSISIAIFIIPDIAESAVKTAEEFHFDLLNELEKYE